MKKFDKKIVGRKNKKKHILFYYIQAKLEEQNSDMLYLFRFKMIDEVNALMENLINELKDQLKNNKKKFKKVEMLNEDGSNIISIGTNDKENTDDLIEKNSNNRGLFYNEVYNSVETIYNKIKKNMKNIDLIAMSTIRLFRPWKQFLRISTEIGSRLMQMNQEINDFEEDYSKRKKV